jgi:hypothetical protein
MKAFEESPYLRERRAEMTTRILTVKIRIVVMSLSSVLRLGFLGIGAF